MSQASTINKKQSLMNEIRDTCYQFGTHCQVKEINTNALKAYSDNHNNIKISKGILNNFTEDEIRSIGYHELSHILLKHHNTWQNYIDNNSFYNMNIQYISNIRHMQEYQADSFASYLLYLNRHSNNLDVALQKVVPVEYRDITTKTHPSINNRINHIKQYKRIYNNYNWSIK